MSYCVLNLPIEPIDRRYSTQWNTWFEAAFTRNGIVYQTIVGDQGEAPAPDKFLDPKSTFLWKYTQLARAVQRCDRSQRYVVFLHDAWMPGIEAFPYLRDIEGLDIAVCGFWHAGSYDATDLLGLHSCYKWAYGSEESWLKICKANFVATNYHADKIQDKRCVTPSSIHIVGCPVEVPNLYLTKEPIVVWPHRLSQDKQPEVLTKLASEPRFKGIQFIRTLDRNLSKQEYYQLLARAKVSVSTATHENFGIAMVESAMLGCYPVCPKGLSYIETMEPSQLYTNYEELVELVDRGLQATQTYEYPFTSKYNQMQVTDAICQTIKLLGDSNA